MSGKNEMDFGTFSLWVIMGVAIGSVFGVALGNIAIGISLGMMGAWSVPCSSARQPAMATHPMASELPMRPSMSPSHGRNIACYDPLQEAVMKYLSISLVVAAMLSVVGTGLCGVSAPFSARSFGTTKPRSPKPDRSLPQRPVAPAQSYSEAP
jgi:hypothetical protein